MDQDLRWVGIDTSSRGMAICILDSHAKVVSEGSVSGNASEAKRFIEEAGGRVVELAIETGTTSMHPARRLKCLGYNVVIYHALSVRRYLRGQRNKTDANDARGLAEIARLGGCGLKRTYLKPPEVFALRSQLNMRERIIQMRKVNEGALMSLFHAFGVRADQAVSSPTSLRRVVATMIENLDAEHRSLIDVIITPLLELSVSLRLQESRIERELERHVRKDEYCSRLIAIPGVGVITAISFVTAVGDPHRFQRSSDVGAYFGLAPRIWSTGSFVRKCGITKKGNVLTRKHLYTAARALLDAHQPSHLQAWGKALALRTNRKRAIVAVARKLAIIMTLMWRDKTSFDPKLDRVSLETTR